MAKKIRLGYPTINAELRNQKPSVFTNRTCRLQTIIDRGSEFAIYLLSRNLDDLLTILKWNEHNNIRFYRISSGIFPHLTNPLLLSSSGRKNFKALVYSLEPVKPKLKAIGAFAALHGHRLTFHSEPYVNLGSPNAEIVLRGCRELYCYALIMHMMGLGPDSIVVLHGGGAYNNKKETIKRWVSVFNALPIAVKRRIALENDEYTYGIDDILNISSSVRRFGPPKQVYKIPIILDIFHYGIYQRLVATQSALNDVFPAIISSWHNLTVKMHISEQLEGGVTGAHGYTIKTIPKYLLDFPKTYNVNRLDLMCESKNREQTVFVLRKKYQKYGVI